MRGYVILHKTYNHICSVHVSVIAPRQNAVRARQDLCNVVDVIITVIKHTWPV